MTSKTTVRKLADDLRKLNPGYKIRPVGDIITIDKEDLLELEWPEGWSFNGYSLAFIPGTDNEVFILGNFDSER